MLNKFSAVGQKFSPHLRQIIGNTAWLFVDQFLRMTVGLLVGVWVARYLGPEQFGLFNYALAFVGMFGPLAALGLNGIVVRDIVRDPECKNETLGTAFALKLIGAIAVLLLTVGIMPLLRPGDRLTQILVGIVALGQVFQAFDAIDFWFQSQVQSKYTVWVKSSAYLVVTILKVLLIQWRAPLIAFALTGLVEIIFGSTGLWIVYKLKGHHITTLKSSFYRAKSLLKESFPLILSGIAIMIYMRIDQVMLGQMIGDESVGIYSAAVRISELWYFIPMKISSSVSPSIVEARKISKMLYYARLQKLFNLMAVLAYAIAIPLTFLSKPIILAIYEKNYAAAGEILCVHTWASLSVFIGVARANWIVTEGFTQISLYTTCLGAIVNIILNLFLIPKYGGLGAAIATVISYAVADYFVWLIHPQLREMAMMMTKSLTLSFLFQRRSFPE